MMQRSTARWCAIAKRLVSFFGGRVKYRDDGDDFAKPDYKVAAKSDIHAEDGDEWNHLHNRILSVTSVTKYEIGQGKKVSAE